MLEREKIKTDQWNKQLESFTDKNKGRLIQLLSPSYDKLNNHTDGDLPLQKITAATNTSKKLITLDFGFKQVDHTYVIESPVEIWHEYNYEGQTMSIEILNKKSEKTIILFKSYISKYTF